MDAKIKAFPHEHLIMTTVTGAFDLSASKVALAAVEHDPSFNAQTEVLLDLREVKCTMSTVDVYQLAEHLASPNPALHTGKKIAVLVTGRAEFEHAQFLQLCASNRGVSIGAFDDYEDAQKWLNANLPPDTAPDSQPH